MYVHCLASCSTQNCFPVEGETVSNNPVPSTVRKPVARGKGKAPRARFESATQEDTFAISAREIRKIVAEAVKARGFTECQTSLRRQLTSEGLSTSDKYRRTHDAHKGMP